MTLAHIEREDSHTPLSSRAQPTAPAVDARGNNLASGHALTPLDVAPSATSWKKRRGRLIRNVSVYAAGRAVDFIERRGIDPLPQRDGACIRRLV